MNHTRCITTRQICSVQNVDNRRSSWNVWMWRTKTNEQIYGMTIFTKLFVIFMRNKGHFKNCGGGLEKMRRRRVASQGWQMKNGRRWKWGTSMWEWLQHAKCILNNCWAGQGRSGMGWVGMGLKDVEWFWRDICRTFRDIDSTLIRWDHRLCAVALDWFTIDMHDLSVVWHARGTT